MESKPQSSASSPPPKPWEHAGSSSGPAPFRPPSAGNTSDVVESSGTAKPGEIVSSSDRPATVNRNSVGRPLPPRPWEQNYGNNSYGGYGSTMNNYNSGYGSGMYGSYGGLGGMNGGGLYGNSMYRGGYSGPYGSSSGMYGGGLYGGGMYNSGFGGPMGGYGMGSPFGGQDPNDPHGGPPSPPGFWISVLRVMHGVVNFFGRIAMLVDQNTQAFHLFMNALLQLFDRSGMLYGELARFVFRVLGIKTKPRKVNPPPQGPNGHALPGPSYSQGNVYSIEGPKAAPSASWDNVWDNDHTK
ncbi:hypothetical protein QN277_002215 [Acacia crassicarpa]|uniref:Peroxin-13 n=1 Tax=Acacia crassicarpa TaxID=499986 RepID=A0AAE1NB88_9FABA|nr:hypothetical protein QN277_002215 [Acacia crassicarpa]